MIFPLVEFVSGMTSVFLTSDNTSTGTRYICSVEGLEKFALTDNIGIQRALDGTVYSQLQPVKDEEVIVRIPRSDFAKFDAIRDLINGAISTTYSLNITQNGESFTFTAKPGGVTYKPTILVTTVEDVAITQYCTD